MHSYNSFRISPKRGKDLLLRIHRWNYHTHAALTEELRCLEELSNKATLIVSRPLRSTRGHLTEEVSSSDVGARRCSLLEWIEGRLIRKNIQAATMRQLGSMIAKLYRAGRGIRVVERKYWDSDGLVGRHPKFGPIENLPEVSAEQQETISKVRLIVYRKLRRFQRTFPNKQGFIHADLHFGNVLFSSKGIAAIDFDDCGLGFYAYDLAVCLVSIAYLKEDRGSTEIARLKDALLDGYAAEACWDSVDDAILPYFFTARKLAMLGWLSSRWTIPH